MQAIELILCIVIAQYIVIATNYFLLKWTTAKEEALYTKNLETRISSVAAILKKHDIKITADDTISSTKKGLH